jgi:hypothetical protein
MRVFCTSCGTPNEGEPGGTVMCVACTAVFGVPADAHPAPEARPPPAADLEPFPAPPAPASGAAWGAPQGSPPAPYAAPGAPEPAAASTNSLAVASFVSSLVCCIPVLSPLVGLVCGLMALSQLKQRPLQKGRGLALAGIVLSSLELAVLAVGFLADGLK